jgi:hypothetical protein
VLYSQLSIEPAQFGLCKVDQMKKEKSALTIFPGVDFRFPREMPNWWWRMWQFVLLGWRWRNLPRTDDK